MQGLTLALALTMALTVDLALGLPRGRTLLAISGQLCRLAQRHLPLQCCCLWGLLQLLGRAAGSRRGSRR